MCIRDRLYGIEMPEAELMIKAEAHAIRNGGRSPRVAKQFIEPVSYTHLPCKAAWYIKEIQSKQVIQC